MNIKNHLLFLDDGQQAAFIPTPNKGGKYTPKYLVMHYTAVTSATSSINWFKNPDAKASAHLLIDRAGNVTQFAPFNTITWHAGQSKWAGINGLNGHAIGIELVNGGRLTKTDSGFLCPTDQRNVSSAEVTFALHRNESQPAHWHQYTEAQMQRTIQIGALLVNHYGLLDVLGHEDISPIRKSDPGPAFPMGSFRSRTMGRENDHLDLYKTTTAVNIRSGAGTGFPTLIKKPLPVDTEVEILKREGNWSFVDVRDEVEGVNDLEGWVNSKFLVQAG